MKNLLKLFFSIVFIAAFAGCSSAIETGEIDNLIKKSPFVETATISISIRNVENNNIVYEREQKKLLHPASTTKIFTTYMALDTLGYDYKFKTQFYKDSENNLYIKLGADPMLTSSQLKQAFQKIKESGNASFKNLYFDDSIIDKKEFSTGWMWDDDVNPYTPKISSYNLDGNVFRINMSKSKNNMISASVKTSYPVSVISSIMTGAKKDYLEINRYNWNSPEVVEIYGVVTVPKTITVPISSMRRYFIHNVEEALEENKINISSTLYASKLVPDNASLITEISNPITRTIPAILQNSNNLMSETIFKLAAGKKYNATGTDELGELLFKEFYKEKGLNTDSIIIKDGCGISRKNLFYADWISEALNKLYKTENFERFKDNMAQSGDGTLAKRLYDLRGDVWLKTGSLSNISTLAGYVNSQDGNTYSVVILIQNFKENHPEIKAFEDEIIKLIYSR